MNIQEVQFQHGEPEDVRVRKLRALVEELARLGRIVLTKEQAEAGYSPIDHPGHLPP